MNNSFKHGIKQYFSFTRKDRNAIIILIILIVVSIGVNLILGLFEDTNYYNYNEYELLVQEWESYKSGQKEQSLFPFDPNTISQSSLDSLEIPVFIKRNIISYRNAGGTFKKNMDVRKIYGMTDSIFSRIEHYIQIKQPTYNLIKNSDVETPDFKGVFDPNEADSATLAMFGFTQFQVKNLIKYRNSGGRFGNPGDLLKIFGVDSVFYLSIQKNIQIQETLVPTINIPRNSIVEKKIELNSADSIDLVKLNGIGPVFARRILNYRNLLGGFSSVDQLLEVYNFPLETFQKSQSKFEVDQAKIQKIRINFAEYTDLLRHPYLTKEHVQSILKYRSENGPFQETGVLIEKSVIDSITYLKIKSYLSCE